MLTPSKRENLLGEIAKEIDGQGGEFEVDYETHLYIARRVDRDHQPEVFKPIEQLHDEVTA
jgi:hypothetical protein